MTRAKRAVLLAAILLLVIWIATHISRLTADPEGVIRLVLGLFFFAWIMLRSKAPFDAGASATRREPPALVVGGIAAFMVLFGLIFGVHQVEWLGIMALLYACFRWSLPDRFRSDILIALFILYWIHPLPTQIFGFFELLLQKLSIHGSEWLLHVFNVPVWADGFILHTGYLAFGVPESCSGAMTAVAVLMCILGLSIVLELKWHQGVIFAVIGLVQVVLLNIIRITGMVYWGRDMQQAWANTVLHDTLGIFLLVAIGLVHFEVFAWKYRAAKEDKGFKRLPTNMRALLTGVPRLLLVVVLLGLLGYGIQRRRPFRHSQLLLPVAQALQERDLELAEKVVREAERLDPANRDVLDERLRIMIKREKYQPVLDAINAMEDPTTIELVMKAQVLTALERIEEAYALLKALPGSAGQWPAVAMIRSEYGAVKDDLLEVRRRIEVAARDPANVHRVRRLFPFLARYEQWGKIANVESIRPHAVVDQALIGIRAQLETERVDEAAGAVQRALAAWPADPRVISLVYEVAMRRPDQAWEERFAQSVFANLNELDTDFLGLYIGYGFDLGRPDVAWVAYRKLAELDPTDPTLYLAVAENAYRWFAFGRGDAQDAADRLERAEEKQQRLSEYRDRWGAIPLGKELRATNARRLRAMYGNRALVELGKRESEGTLTERMLLQYPSVLVLLQQLDEARKRLDQIAEAYPNLRSRAWTQSARLYAQDERWEDTYEKLRLVAGIDNRPSLAVRMLMLQAATELGRGLTAMHVARRARAQFPDAVETRIGLAAAWFGVADPAQALLVLEDGEEWIRFPGLPQTLYATGRIQAARRLARVMDVELDETGTGGEQQLDLDPAENVIDGALPELPARDAWAAMADRIAEQQREARSDYGRQRLALEAEWYRSGGKYSVASWEAVGRDPVEKAELLHRLAILLARAGMDAEARTVLRRAANHLPSSEGIWRLLVTLDPRETRIREALKRCPNDPHIWLASLVTKVRSVEPDDRAELSGWALQEARRATQGRRHSPETLVRAGTYLMRRGFSEAASLIARSVVKRARGFLPAHALEVRCAIASDDSDWALSAAARAVGAAVDPEPFYKTIAYIKMQLGLADSEAKRALQYLMQNADDTDFWEEKLAIALFREGDYRRSAEMLNRIAAKADENDKARLTLLAAEAQRLRGESDSNLAVLRGAYAARPDRVDILNNLVYALSDEPGMVNEAVRLLPQLIEKAREDFRVLDTIAVVYLRSGDVESAKEWAEKAIAGAPQQGYHAAEAYMNAAEIQYAAGDRKAALNLIETARKRAKLPADLDRRALKLLWRIQKGRD